MGAMGSGGGSGRRLPTTNADLAEDTLGASKVRSMGGILCSQLQRMTLGEEAGSDYRSCCLRGRRTAGGAAGLGGAGHVPSLVSSALGKDRDRGTGCNAGTEVAGRSTLWVLGPAHTEIPRTCPASLPSKQQ